MLIKAIEWAAVVVVFLLAVSCRGPQGPQGIMGAAGSDGVAGSDGANGADGRPRLVLHATKLHINAGSVFIPEERTYIGSVVVPASLRLITGIGSNDACAAKLQLDAVDCCYSPKSNVNNPSQSNKGQAKNSIVYELISCTDGSEAGDVFILSDRVRLELNKADSLVGFNTIRAEL